MTSTEDGRHRLRRAFRALDWPAVVIAALCAFGALAVVFFANTASAPAGQRQSMLPVDSAAAAVPLVDSDGRNVVWGSLSGAPRAVFFGFTRCPEICPTTIAELSAAIQTLGPGAGGLRVDFVSLDPARDTPELLKAYFSSFGPRFHGYTGREADVARLAQAYHVFYQRVPAANGDYTLNHTAVVYLIDARGTVVDFIAYQTPPDRAAAQLRRLVS